MNSNTTNERAQVSRCAEPRLQTRMTDLTSESLWALVLAGGDGTRLQSLAYLIAALGTINRHRGVNEWTKEGEHDLEQGR